MDSAKKYPICPEPIQTGGVIMVFPHAGSNRKYVNSIENLILSMFYSCQFCT